jgi:hypothetical protein
MLWLENYCFVVSPANASLITPISHPMLEPDCNIADIAEHYRQLKSWLCAECSSFRYGVDKILAWRPYPADAVEVFTDPKEIPNYKSHKYLIKWSGRSYRRVQWVPHMCIYESLETQKLHFWRFESRAVAGASSRSRRHRSRC